MSRASEWADAKRTMNDRKPRCLVNGVEYPFAIVDDRGFLRFSNPTDLEPEQALVLARWILEVFTD